MRHTLTAILTILTLASFGQGKDSTRYDETILITDPVPSYPGGHAAMKAFIAENLEYPKGFREYEGTVFVEFFVNEDGSLSDFKIVKSLVKPLDDSAVEMLKKMPKWIPAVKDNKPIRAKMVIPVRFHL